MIATRLVLLSVALMLVPGPSSAGETGRPADHVVLISLDGLRPEFYLDASWPAPMIQQMQREGTAASEARGVYPSVTYPTHTTMITGALPDRHGIYYNSPFEPDGATGRWYWDESAIRVPTLWDALRAAGLTSAALSWPVTVGAPIDWNLPEIWSISESETSIDALRRASSPQELWEEIEREATGRLTLENFDITWITRDDRAGDIAAYLLTSRRPNLLAVHLIEVDHFQHDEGRDGSKVHRSLSTADSAISQIVEAAERTGMIERTTFIVTGDHGFIDVQARLAPNVWLVEAGLRTAAPDRGEWRATFHTTAASAFLHLADPDDEITLERVRDVLSRLPPEQRALFRILEADELADLGAAPEAALGLALRPGVDATSSPEAPAVRPRGGANHGFLPDYEQMATGFIAWGSGIDRRDELIELDLSDIAPLVAHLLGLDFEAPDGRLPRAFTDGPGEDDHSPRP